MAWQVQEYLKDRELMCKWQSGFRSNHSCETALVKLTCHFFQSLDLDHVTILVLLDFSKAFNSIAHDPLLRKLKNNFYFGSSSVKLLCSFLSGGWQQTKINGAYSSLLPLVSGVPQGSVLGPLLFSLFINDLPRVVQDASVHLYADDVQLYLSRPVGLLEDCVARLNEDLSRVFEWSTKNSLMLNPAKSVCLPISRSDLALDDLSPLFLGSTPLRYEKCVKSLGLPLNSRMTCCDFIKSSLSKIYGCLRLLRFYSYLLSKELKMKLVKSLILPHFTYCRLPFLKLDSICQRKVEIAFNDCVRYIYNIKRREHISPFVDSILGRPLEEYIMRRSAVFLHIILMTKQPEYLYEYMTFLSSSRHCNLLIPRFQSKFGERSFLVQAICFWNTLPLSICSISSPGVFKRRLFS